MALTLAAPRPTLPVMSHDRSRIFFCSYSGRNVRQMVLSTGAVTTIAGRDFGNVDGIDACEIQESERSRRARACAGPRGGGAPADSLAKPRTAAAVGSPALETLI